MKKALRIRGVCLALTPTALLGLGCAQLSQRLAAFQTTPPRLEAQGPGTVFGGIECAAVDALIYAYLQAQAARDGRMRGGTIYAAGEGYSYDEIVVAGPSLPNSIFYALKSRDVARFHIYAPASKRDPSGISERPTRADRRSVRFVDPLHRPLYILHPSLIIREYRGNDHEPVEVANLRRPARPQQVAGAVRTPRESAMTRCSRPQISRRFGPDVIRHAGTLGASERRQTQPLDGAGVVLHDEAVASRELTYVTE